VAENLASKVGETAFFAVLYIVLFYASDALVDAQHYQGVASWFFLPAFVRLLGFLMIGLRIIPALLVSSLFLVASGGYDFGPGYAPDLVVAVATAVGGPIGAWAVAAWTKLDRNLAELSPPLLLALSAGCAFGNALAFEIAIIINGLDVPSLKVFASMFVGDMLGTWAVLYALKFTGSLLRAFHMRPRR